MRTHQWAQSDINAYGAIHGGAILALMTRESRAGLNPQALLTQVASVDFVAPVDPQRPVRIEREHEAQVDGRKIVSVRLTDEQTLLARGQWHYRIPEI